MQVGQTELQSLGVVAAEEDVGGGVVGAPGGVPTEGRLRVILTRAGFIVQTMRYEPRTIIRPITACQI